MFRSLTLLVALAIAGCASSVSIAQSGVPFHPACDYAESRTPFCLDPVKGLTCYGAEASVADDGSIVCIWRCVELEPTFYQDVYAVFNPEPAIHLDTMVLTGPAAQCD